MLLRLVSGLVVVGAMLAVSPVWAQDTPVPDAAKEHHAKAKELYGKGDFEGAIAEWKQAYEQAQLPGYLFNMARAYEQAGRIDEAIRHYQRYLQAAGDPPDRGAVEATI